MLVNAAGILAARCIIIPAEEMPARWRFDESRATPGAILAREVFAKAAGVPPHAVQFTPRFLLTNQDDMSAFYNRYLKDGSCAGGDINQNQKMIVDLQAADQSYGLHGRTDISHQFNGIKL